MEKVLPYIQIVVAVGAAAIYIYYGDIRRAIYWLAAATITASVTL